jgi:hypothetical protein
MTEKIVAQFQFNWMWQRQLLKTKRLTRTEIIAGYLFARAFIQQVLNIFAFGASELNFCSGAGLNDSFERQIKTGTAGRELRQALSHNNTPEHTQPPKRERRNNPPLTVCILLSYMDLLKAKISLDPAVTSIGGVQR